jgi:hypothetical protein
MAPVETDVNGHKGGSIMKEILITLALAAALVASACTDESPLSPDPLPGNQQRACQGSESERPCPADPADQTSE